MEKSDLLHESTDVNSQTAGNNDDDPNTRHQPINALKTCEPEQETTQRKSYSGDHWGVKSSFDTVQMETTTVDCVLDKISKEADKSANHDGEVDEADLIGGETVDISKHIRETADLDV